MPNKLITPQEAAKGCVKIINESLKGLSSLEKQEVLDMLSAMLFQSPTTGCSDKR